jgi:hypothetical protein
VSISERLEMQPPLVLLGAGASAPAGIPTAVKMTSDMLALASGHHDPLIGRTMHVICGTLQTYAAARGLSRAFMPDIERVLDATHQLRDREDLELTPFISAWNPAVLALRESSFEIANIASELSRIGRYGTIDPHELVDCLEQAFQTLAAELRGHKSSLTWVPFEKLRSFLTNKLIELAWLNSFDKLAYLKPLVKRGQHGRITIATLNYDNTIEMKALEECIPVDTGMRSWITTGSLGSPPNGIELIKLHGSLDWIWREPSVFNSGRPPHKYICQLEADEMRDRINSVNLGAIHLDGSPAIIFGGRNKLTAEGPFLDLLIQFRKRLLENDRLMVIGYSFRDNHINALIEFWLRRTDVHMTIIGRPNGTVVDNEFVAELPMEFRSRIKYEPSGAETGIATHFGELPESKSS